MIFRLPVVLALAALLSHPAAAEGGAVPHPTAAVGVILRGGVAVCTGALIAPDLVVTAAHCLEPEGSGGDPTRIRFRTGAYPGTVAVEGGAVRIVRHPLYPGAGESAPLDRRAGYDLALVRLAAPVPASAALPLALARGAAVAPRLLVASYRGGQGERARERMCPVIDAGDRMIRMGCDVRPGESGAPVLQREGDGLVLVGVLSARAEDGPQKLALAAASARIGQLRALMGHEGP
jgi:protease YdgD